jgi:uncharacterized YigZ family protein
MKSIKNTKTNEIIIKNSRFINLLLSMSTVDEFDKIYPQVKDTYKNANHYCYAYIVGDNQDQQKYSDDGEPSSTAGIPMLEVLKKHDITNILAITIRYFGGVKLGASGLIRAYAKSVSENIKDAKFTSKKTFSKILITIPFDEIGHVEHYLRSHFTLEDTTYDTQVHYHLEVRSKQLNQFESSLQEKTNGIAKVEKLKEEDRYE